MIHTHKITYSWPGAGEITTRRALLVRPPGHQPLVVVVESHDEPGWPIQLAAEEIALTIAQDFPGFTTVLHYETDRDTETRFSLRDCWMPIPVDDDGHPIFGMSLAQHPDVAASLQAAGLQH